MTDRLVHVEKDVTFTHAEIAAAIQKVTGLAPPPPGSITTGCGARRPTGRTSAIPEQVTCPACRDHARAEHQAEADAAETLARYLDAGLLAARPGHTAATMREHAAVQRDLAARYARPAASRPAQAGR